jgi:hypothetical protein
MSRIRVTVYDIGCGCRPGMKIRMGEDTFRVTNMISFEEIEVVPTLWTSIKRLFRWLMGGRK